MKLTGGLAYSVRGGSGLRVCWPRRRGGACTGLRKWAMSGKGKRAAVKRGVSGADRAGPGDSVLYFIFAS